MCWDKYNIHELGMNIILAFVWMIGVHHQFHLPVTKIPPTPQYFPSRWSGLLWEKKNPHIQKFEKYFQTHYNICHIYICLKILNLYLKVFFETFFFNLLKYILKNSFKIFEFILKVLLLFYFWLIKSKNIIMLRVF